MRPLELTAQKLLDVEVASLPQSEQHWHLSDYESELASERSQLFWSESVDGFVLYRKLDSEVEIVNLAVRLKGEGRGARLMTEFFSLFKAPLKIFLEVKSTNVRAVALYKKMGFKEVGQRPRYYRDLSDALLMSLELG